MTFMVRLTIMLALTLGPVVPASAQPDPNSTWRERGAFAALFVSDAQAMVRWYVDVLGFKIVMNNPNLGSRDIAQAALLERHGSALELLQQRVPQGEVFPDRARDPQTLGIIKIGFVVEDLDGLEAALTKRDIPFNHHSIRSQLNGFRTFAIRDPEGNTIQFFGK